MRRLGLFLPLAATLVLAAGCGSSGSSGGELTVGTPKTFGIVDFEPAKPVTAGKPFKVRFAIRQPDGKLLTAYKRGAGPHTGVHLIFARRDLSQIVHLHPAIESDGRIDTEVTLPRPGPYMLLVDAYANLEGQPPNFQLKQDMEVSGAYKPEKTPPFQAKQVVDGYTFTVRGKPKVRALEPSTMVVQITDPQGKPAKLEPWFGALAHAIFFRTGSLDYFHTHVCGPNLPGCAGSGTGPIGTSTKPGELRAGILLPVSGKWRLFLQAKANGHTLSAPFTLNVG